MQARYERLSIAEIAAIVDRLAAATQAYDVAMGWR